MSVVALAAALPPLVQAAPPLPDPGSVTPLSSDVQHLHFRYGPLHIPAGQNLILIGPVTIEKPATDGYVVGFRPNMVGTDGAPPPTEVVHLHHGVFLNMSRRDTTAPQIGGERFFATGEEKTQFEFPYPYGYFSRGSDVWALNYMLHNETTSEQTVWITYDVDFVAASSDLGKRMKAVTPVWMDVENGKAYPVFDVHRGSGSGGRFTYPEQAQPYPYHGAPSNEWTMPADGTLVGTAGHVHPGGLWTDLDAIRPGTKPARPRRDARCAKKRRRRHRRRRCSRHMPAPIRGHEPGSVRVFRSRAHYFDPSGPVSWDLAMTRPASNWRVALKKGDKLVESATYETQRASWYESMGINVAYIAFGDHEGVNPFRRRVAQQGFATHGHLAENNNLGGQALPGSADPTKAPDGQTLAKGVAIAGFQYLPGNLGLPAPTGLPPVVHQGDQLRFGNFDAPEQIFHTITACAAPCNKSTGLAYPLADGPVDFDSGDLGHGPDGFTAAAQREDWYTPKNLAPGTYTYFCRIHPFMRGAFRVVPK